MAAASGAGLPSRRAHGARWSWTSRRNQRVAVISLVDRRLAVVRRVGGDELDEAIKNYVKREYKLLIGQQTAEEVNLEIGSAFPTGEECSVPRSAAGHGPLRACPRRWFLTSEEIRGALDENR